MKYAKLIKLGGELISADNADYPDYEGFFRCPECGQSVFLRKSHTRSGLKISSAFAHYNFAAPDCELRVAQYDARKFQFFSTVARNQRLSKLNISMWKFIKSSIACNFDNYSNVVRRTKIIPILGEVVNYAEALFPHYTDFTVRDTLPRLSHLYFSRDSKISTIPEAADSLEAFLKSRSRDWHLHEKIAAEALEHFLTSSYMKRIRYRLFACITSPDVMGQVSELMDLDTATDDWKTRFLAYITLELCIVFLSIDWLEIFPPTP